MKKWSIANRIQLSLVTAIGMVLIIGFLSFYYINQLNKGLEQITLGIDQVIQKDIKLAQLTEEIKRKAFQLEQRRIKFFTNPREPELLNDVKIRAASLKSLTTQAKEVSLKKKNIKNYETMEKLIEEFLVLIENIETKPSIRLESAKQQLKNRLVDFSKLNAVILQDRYDELELHQQEINTLRLEAQKKSSDAQRNMIIVVLLMLFSGLGLGFVAPNVVTAPFKKMIQAINEVRTGKLNISIPVEADDEIGQIAKSLNNMIHELREFDEMKIKRIAFEKRRFDTLANMVDYGVMVLKREGVIEFINTQLYLLIKCDTKEIEGYRIEHTPLPQEIKDFLLECLETKEKIDNREITIHLKNKKGEMIPLDLLADTGMVRTHDGTIVNMIITFEEKTSHVDKEYLARLISRKEKEEQVSH